MKTLAAAAAVLLAAADPEPKAPPAIVWEHDLQASLRAARATGRPVLVKFHKTTCPVCRKVEGELKDPRVASRALAFINVEIDVDKDPGLANRAQTFVEVQSGLDRDPKAGPERVGVPDLRILAPDGAPLGRLGGPVTAEQIAKFQDETLGALKEARRKAILVEVSDLFGKKNFAATLQVTRSALARKEEIGFAPDEAAALEKTLSILDAIAKKLVENGRRLEGEKKPLDAAQSYYMVAFAFEGLAPAREARERLDGLLKDAESGPDVRRMIQGAEARGFYEGGERQEKEKRFLLAKRYYGDVLAKFPGSEWAKKAGDALARMDGDAGVQAAMHREADQLTADWGTRAAEAAAHGDRAEAERLWKALVQEFPDHPASDGARKALGLPPRPAPRIPAPPADPSRN